jgi:hypothetical protein
MVVWFRKFEKCYSMFLTALREDTGEDKDEDENQHDRSWRSSTLNMQFI